MCDVVASLGLLALQVLLLGLAAYAVSRPRRRLRSPMVDAQSVGSSMAGRSFGAATCRCLLVVCIPGRVMGVGCGRALPHSICCSAWTVVGGASSAASSF